MLTDEAQPKVSVAGRIVVFRVMGKASFIKIQDRDGQIQAYVTRDELPDGEYNTYFKKLDLGDIIGITGRLFKTKTGEITVRCRELHTRIQVPSSTARKVGRPDRRR